MKLKVFAIHTDAGDGNNLQLFTSEAEYNAVRERMIHGSGDLAAIAILDAKVGEDWFENAWQEYIQGRAPDIDYIFAYEEEIELPPQFDALFAATHRTTAWMGCNVFPPECHHIEELRALHHAQEAMKE